MTAKILPLRRSEGRTPNTKSGNVPPRNRPNAERRAREYLTPDEVERLIKAAGATEGRHAHRDATLILIAYRHGLRVSELIALRWDMLDMKAGSVHVSRRKNGRDSVHPLRGPELRALRRLRRDYPDTPYLFVTERGGPVTGSTVRHILKQAGAAAGLAHLDVHPHMLRHAAGYKLANDGVDTRLLQQYLGHKNIQHTVRYTELAPERFNRLWRD